MGTKAENKLATAEQRRRRQRARAERRRADRALVPMAVAQRLGIGVATVAHAMRMAGITTAITETHAEQWRADPGSTPQWLVRLRGER